MIITFMYKLELLNSSIYILFPPFLSHVFGNLLFLQVLQNVTLQLASQFKRKREKKKTEASYDCAARSEFFSYVWSEVQTQRENPSVNKTRILNQSSKQKAYICTRVLPMYWLIIGFLGSIAVELRENEDVGIKQYQCTLNFKAQCILFCPSNSQSPETCPW